MVTAYFEAELLINVCIYVLSTCFRSYIHNRVIQLERMFGRATLNPQPKNGKHLKYLIDQSISTLVLCYNIVAIHLGSEKTKRRGNKQNGFLLGAHWVGVGKLPIKRMRFKSANSGESFLGYAILCLFFSLSILYRLLFLLFINSMRI